MTEDKILMNKELQQAHDYWYKEWSKKEKQIDTLCVRSAERLNDIRYKLWKEGPYIDFTNLVELQIEQGCLQNNLQHFHGELDEEYIRGHNLGPVYWEE